MKSYWLRLVWDRAAPGVHLLVTSRQKLGLQGERLYALEGLAYPLRSEEVTDAGQLREDLTARPAKCSPALLKKESIFVLIARSIHAMI